MNFELSDVQAGFRKGRGSEIKLPTFGSPKKVREFQNIYFCFTDYTKAFDCVVHNRLDNSLRDGSIRPPYLFPEKPVCRSRSNS